MLCLHFAIRHSATHPFYWHWRYLKKKYLDVEIKLLYFENSCFSHCWKLTFCVTQNEWSKWFFWDGWLFKIIMKTHEINYSYSLCTVSVLSFTFNIKFIIRNAVLLKIVLFFPFSYLNLFFNSIMGPLKFHPVFSAGRDWTHDLSVVCWLP